MINYQDLSPKVAAALKEGVPVVALESTVIAHGLPTEVALRTAAWMCNVIRNEGAIPAIVGLFDGKIKIGLTNVEIEHLATEPDVLIVSRRDFAYALATRRTGATTVASTMMAAEIAGIPIMTTGGIGGVHRGAEISMDISADLRQLASTRVAVVCSGAKAILDLPKTLEYLETMGVPVIGYKTNDFPAFFKASSGLSVTQRIDEAAEIAALIELHQKINLMGGILIANPPPKDAALDEHNSEAAIIQAIEQSHRANIQGTELTPYLLNEIAQTTDGKSIEANRALLVSNAKLSAKIACSLAKHRLCSNN